ncbi:hypothetical protein STEG23_031984, partial [Scotinomys teguina]
IDCMWCGSWTWSCQNDNAIEAVDEFAFLEVPSAATNAERTPAVPERPSRALAPGILRPKLAFSLFTTSHESICLAAGPTHPTPAALIEKDRPSMGINKAWLTKQQ